MIFLNRGDHFEAMPLPAEAQLAPASYAGVADFDGDGHEDLFLSQNFFPTSVGTPRYDTGRGLLLLGDGKGGFTPMTGTQSGIASMATSAARRMPITTATGVSISRCRRTAPRPNSSTIAARSRAYASAFKGLRRTRTAWRVDQDRLWRSHGSCPRDRGGIWLLVAERRRASHGTLRSADSRVGTLAGRRRDENADPSRRARIVVRR